MKTTKLFAIAAAMVLIAAHGFAANTFYVDSIDGNDANPGTSAAPWRTIQKAADSMVAGDGVVVAAGRYPERVVVSRSGILGSEISFSASGLAECRGFTIRADHIAVKGFKVTAIEASWNAPAYGFWVEGRSCRIEDNYAYYSPRGGINLRPSSLACIVRNNRCHRNGMEGMEIHGTGNLIENNEVWGSVAYHTPTGAVGDADGIRFFGSGHVFRGNYIHDISHQDPENAGQTPHIDGFQTWSDSYHASASGLIFERNRVILPDYKTCGFMLEDCNNLTIKNNLIHVHNGTNTYGDGGGTVNHLIIVGNTFTGSLGFLRSNFPVGISLQNCPDSVVRDNIVYDQVDWAIYLEGTTLTGLNISNNCVHNSNGSTPKGTRQPYDLWNQDPLFENPGAGDYHLRPGSPCIDAGMPIAGLTDDFDGLPRPAKNAYDIGACEFQAEANGEAPAISVQPSSRTVPSGQAVTLSVTATGTAPMTYQWYRGTSGNTADPVAGSTSSSYTTPSLMQNASYWVRVVNDFGQQDSLTAVITVTAAATLPTVVTTAVSSITATGGTAGGTVSADGGVAVTARGVCWGPAANPALSGSHTSDGLGTGSFTSALAGLSPKTTYHVRAYATNSLGTSYGSDVSFMTADALTLPSVATSIASAITTTGAISGGTVSADGGSAVTVRGVCWGPAANPMVSGPHTSDGSGTGAYASSVTGLSPETSYHIRAYATNSYGTAYGNDVSFTTPAPQVPTVPFLEAFNGAIIPDGWTVRNEGTGVADKWAVSETGLASGHPNEMHCSWQDVVTGTTRLVTPAFDTTGHSVLYMSFKHRLRTFGAGGVTLKIQTSPDGATWTDESWSVLTSSTDIGPESVHTTLSGNLNRATTYVALTLTGNLHDFDVWDIDDIALSATPPGVLRAPALASPRNGATKQPTILKVGWKDTNTTQAEEGYRVRIRPANEDYAYYDTVRDARTYLLSGLKTGTTYYWNVMALGDNAGTLDSPWANSGKDRQFTTGSKVTLLPTTLLEPVASGSSQATGIDGSSATSSAPIVTTSPVLRWQDTNSDPQEVRYEIRIKPKGGRYVIRPSGPNAVDYMAGNLRNNTIYCWNIRAKGDRKTTLNSAWANSGKDGIFQTRE